MHRRCPYNDPYGSNTDNESLGSHGSNEASHSNKNKYRSLPCKVFISTGTCPFDERCVFLHDSRIQAQEQQPHTHGRGYGHGHGMYSYRRGQRGDHDHKHGYGHSHGGHRSRSTSCMKSSETFVQDALFWPPMQDAHHRFGTQAYFVPVPDGNPHSNNNGEAIFSVWNTFVEFLCSADRYHPCGTPLISDPPSPPVNVYTGKTRLRVFRELARG